MQHMAKTCIVSAHLSMACFMCRPEWPALIHQPQETMADYTERLKRAGLQLTSRNIRHGESIPKVLQDLLRISAAEAAALLRASDLAGTNDSLPSSEAAGASLGAAAGRQGTGNAAGSVRDGGSETELPDGISRSVRIKAAPEGRYKVMVRLQLACSRHGARRIVRGYSEAKTFLDAHAACMCAPC